MPSVYCVSFLEICSVLLLNSATNDYTASSVFFFEKVWASGSLANSLVKGTLST